MKACAGDWVEVLSKEDILRTLDKNGRLDKADALMDVGEQTVETVRSAWVGGTAKFRR
jgi:hypothetical protein